jgi:hypothetical protein
VIVGGLIGLAQTCSASQPLDFVVETLRLVLLPASLIVEQYGRWASPDRIGPVQDPVWAKYVVAWWIAVNRAGVIIRKELPPDLDPEAAWGRPAPRAGHVVGPGHETARLMTVGSTLFCVRACGRFGHSLGRRARQCQQCHHADYAVMLRAVAQAMRRPMKLPRHIK